jgi:hypothetical protein
VIEHVAVIADADRGRSRSTCPSTRTTRRVDDDDRHVPRAVMREPYHLAKDKLVADFEKE